MEAEEPMEDVFCVFRRMADDSSHWQRRFPGMNCVVFSPKKDPRGAKWLVVTQHLFRNSRINYELRLAKPYRDPSTFSESVWGGFGGIQVPSEKVPGSLEKTN